MEFVALEQIKPAWDVWNSQFSGVVASALKLDALLSSHPVEVTVEHPREIGAIFDTISYAKGASLLRMLAAFLGRSTFFNSLKRYLSSFAYSAAASSDLWCALQAEIDEEPAAPSGESTTSARIDVGALMGEWTSQTGYPVITIRPATEVESEFTVTQERFLINPSALPREADSSSSSVEWWIPLRIRSGNTTAETRIVWKEKSPTDATLQLALLSARRGGSWTMLNGGGSGFFRVDYDDAGWEALRLALATSATPTLDGVPAETLFLGELLESGSVSMDVLTKGERVVLLDDALALGAAGRRSATLFLDLAFAVLEGEGEGEGVALDPTVGRTVVGGLRTLVRLYGQEAPRLKEQILRAVAPHAARLDVAGLLNACTEEAAPQFSMVTNQLRVDMLKLVLSCGDAALVRRARAIFGRVARTASSSGVAAALVAYRSCASPDVRGLVLGVAARGGGSGGSSGATIKGETWHVGWLASGGGDAGGAESLGGADLLLEASEAFDVMVALYSASDVAGEKQQLLEAIGLGADGDGDDGALAQRVLGFVLSDAVRMQDFVYAVASLCATKRGASAVWTKLITEWVELKTRLGGLDTVWRNFLGVVLGTGPYTDARFGDISTFVDAKHEEIVQSGAERRVAQALEAFEGRLKRVVRQTAQVRGWRGEEEGEEEVVGVVVEEGGMD